jgi:hypothetical protein
MSTNLYGPEAIAERGARMQREAVEGLRRIQKIDGICFADLFEQAGNQAAADEFRSTVDNPDYVLPE